MIDFLFQKTKEILHALGRSIQIEYRLVFVLFLEDVDDSSFIFARKSESVKPRLRNSFKWSSIIFFRCLSL